LIRLRVIVGLALVIIFPLGLLLAFISLIDIIYTGYINQAFLIFGLLYSVVGYVVYKYMILSGRVEPGLLESLIAFSLTWLLIPVLFSIPLLVALKIPIVDAVFEAISGFTGTGLTVLIGLDNMKPSILIWRAIMQWIGELGLIVFATVLMPFIWRFSHVLYSLERPVRITLSLRRSAIRIFQLYLLITLIGIVACVFTGMSILDAVVHTMTAIATGGMSNYDANYQRIFEYAPLSIYPITVLMFLGGVNFSVLSYIVSGEFKRAWLNEEFRAYLYLTLTSILTPLILLLPRFNWSMRDALIYGSFNTLSGFTTTGFSIGVISELPVDVRILITIFMFIGSMSFSTVGGIKVVRLLVLIKAVKSYVVNIISGGVIQPLVKLGNSVLEEREVSNNLLLIVLHFISVLTGAFLIKTFMLGVDMVNALFETTSAASAVGLSTGITSPQAPVGVKLVLIALMYLGRLEYIPLLTLIGVVIYRKHPVLAK
jgi:trk system potassium uptake protein TrkH